MLRKVRQRARKLLLLLGATSVLGAACGPALRAYREERRGFISNPRPARLTPAQFGIAGLAATSFRSRTGELLTGVYAPPSPASHGACIVLTHGAGGEHSDMANEARLLASAGFGVLAFDWPGHGQSQGKIEWGRSERLALSGALDWLSAQPGIDHGALGALGFSMGGYIVVQVAAGDQRLKAVALAGTPHDPTGHTRWEYRRWGILTQWPALLAIRVSGMRLDELVPEQIIGAIAPRPLLLIQGERDDRVPLWMTERLLLAASDPKQLLVVKGAGHGGYQDADPVGYRAALVAFFEQLQQASPRFAHERPPSE